MRHGNAKTRMSRLAAAKKKRAHRNQMRAHGFKLVQVWLHPDDRGHVLRRVRKLMRARLDAAR
jgi:hypothetical protein